MCAEPRILWLHRLVLGRRACGGPDRLGPVAGVALCPRPRWDAGARVGRVAIDKPMDVAG